MVDTVSPRRFFFKNEILCGVAVWRPFGDQSTSCIDTGEARFFKNPPLLSFTPTYIVKNNGVDRQPKRIFFKTNCDKIFSEL